MKKYKVTKSFRFGGKLYHVYADTEREAYEKLALKKHDLETGHVIVNGNMFFSDWAEKCFNTYKAASAKEETVKSEWLSFKKWVLPYIGSYAIKDIKQIQCQEILNAMAGMSSSLVDKIMINLHFVFEKACLNKMIFENPAEGLSKPKTTKGRRRTITSYERRHLALVCDKDPRYVFFQLMLSCGLRPEEAAEVRRSDIKVKDGKYLLHVRGTKTANSDRYVPLPAYLYEKLKDKGPFDLLAPNSSGRKHTKSSYCRMVEHLKRDLNISMGVKTYRNRLVPPLRLAPDFVPYDLRHTYCTDLQKAGVDVRTAQKLMGHASIQITADIYTHVDQESILDVCDVLGATGDDKKDDSEVG